MKMSKFLLPFFVSSLALSSYALADDEGGGRGLRHVLLISVDGLHAVDLANYIKANPGSTLADLN